MVSTQAAICDGDLRNADAASANKDIFTIQLNRIYIFKKKMLFLMHKSNKDLSALVCGASRGVFLIFSHSYLILLANFYI